MQEGPIVAVAQFRPGADRTANLEAVRRLVEEGVDRGADLVVLPEYSAWFDGAPGPALREHAEDLDGPFVGALAGLAGRTGAHVVAGLAERAGDRVFNTVVAVGGDGIAAAYRKLHLYDAFGERESDHVAPGETSEPQVFRVDGMGCGLQTCYDLRFPEVTRRLVDAGADLVLVPAEWVPGPGKEHHWRTLLTARAIESTVFVAAADHMPPAGVGGSTVIDPTGAVVAGLGEQEGVAVAPVSAARVRAVRAVNPSLAMRRFRIVPRD